jgi:hypothetical protein
VLMRAGRALALGGGPDPERVPADALLPYTQDGPLEADPRVEAYKAEQRGERR